MKYALMLLAALAAFSTPAHARGYPFTLADPDPKAEQAVRELYDAGKLKSLGDKPQTLVAIWLKAADGEEPYIFVSPHGICDKASCWIMGFRHSGIGWSKVYDQPVSEDIDIGLTPHLAEGHHDIVQVEEQGDKRIEKISSWSGSRYDEPRTQENTITPEDTAPADSDPAAP